MTDAEIKATVEREQRTDRAERRIAVDGAPTFSYQAQISWRNRAKKTHVWVPRSVLLEWDQGVLRRVRVSGVKLKADGTPGALKAFVSFQVKEGQILPGRQSDERWDESATEPPAWLVGLVTAYADPPPFKGLHEVGA